MDQHLFVFVTVVEKGNFSKAAAELHMTQPAVSQYIQTLERTYGMKLLDRNSKFVRLNKPGEIVYYYAKEILSLYAKMDDHLSNLTNQPKGPIKIGASFSFGEYVLPQYISRLHHTFPSIQPSVTIGNTTEISELVARNRLDIGIIEGDEHLTHLQTDAIADDLMYIVASSTHKFVKNGISVSLDELEKETWIVREEGSGTREATEKLFKQLAISPKNIMEFGSTQVIKESVEAGLGISLLSQWTIRKEQLLEVIKVIPVPGTPFKRKFSIIMQNSSFITKPLEVFIEMLKNEVQ